MMVATTTYLKWRCPLCGFVWASESTPRESTVHHVHDGMEIQMTFVGAVQV